MKQYANGEPVKIYLSANARNTAANAVALTIRSMALPGTDRTLAAGERLLIYWIDSTGPDGTKCNLLDGGGTALPTNLIGAFSTLQVGIPKQPMVGTRGLLPKIYFPGSTDNSLSTTTFGYGEIVKG